MKDLNYYKSNETLSQSFYQIPQELFENQLYKNKINSDSKILYSFLLDRLELSKKNHWVDENDSVYLIFTREEVGKKLGLSEKTVTKAFKQLADVDLIYEKRQGLGKPNLIYIAKIQYSKCQEDNKKENQDMEKVQVLNRKIYGSGTVKNTVQEQENFPTINTNNINTNIINTESINHNSNNKLELKDIKEKCKLSEFEEKDRVILEDVIDGLYYSNTLKVGNVTTSHLKILEKLKLITKQNLIQLLEILKNTPNIKNTKNYLMICLYNNLGNQNMLAKTEKEIKLGKYGRMRLKFLKEQKKQNIQYY